MKRTYCFNASRPGGSMNWPGFEVTSDARIRVVLLVMFRKWFGTHPTWYWHKDGFMAEAEDRRGNRVMLEQINREEPYHE